MKKSHLILALSILCIVCSGCNSSPMPASQSDNNSNVSQQPISSLNSDSNMDEKDILNSSSLNSSLYSRSDPNWAEPQLSHIIFQYPYLTKDCIGIRADITTVSLFRAADDIQYSLLKLALRERDGATLEATAANTSDFFALEQSEQGNDFIDGYCQVETDEIWVRLHYDNFSPTGSPAGGNPPDKKDIVVFVDTLNSNDAFLALQHIDDSSLWTLYRLPNYGIWLSTEIRLYMANNA